MQRQVATEPGLFETPERCLCAQRVDGVDRHRARAQRDRDAVRPGERLILVDDLLATGGTAEAAVKLLRSLGASVLAACFIVDLPELGGNERLAALQVPVRSLVSFSGA